MDGFLNILCNASNVRCDSPTEEAKKGGKRPPHELGIRQERVGKEQNPLKMSWEYGTGTPGGVGSGQLTRLQENFNEKEELSTRFERKDTRKCQEYENVARHWKLARRENCVVALELMVTRLHCGPRHSLNSHWCSGTL